MGAVMRFHLCEACGGAGGFGDLGHNEPDGGWSGYAERCERCKGTGDDPWVEIGTVGHAAAFAHIVDLETYLADSLKSAA